MNEETKEKLQVFLDWLYNEGYINDHTIGHIINFTDKGRDFMKRTFEECWVAAWGNLCEPASMWLPDEKIEHYTTAYEPYEYWDYCYFIRWSDSIDRRLDLLIKLTGANLNGNDDYIDLDDIIM